MAYRVLDGIRVWDGKSHAGYTFTKKPQKQDLGYQFLRYIDWAEKNDYDATRKLFMSLMGKPDSPGYDSCFFSAAGRAGIVEKERKGRTWIYKRGPNADAYEKGELCAFRNLFTYDRKMIRVVLLGENLR